MFVYVISPTTTLLPESTTITDGNFSKLWFTVQVLAAEPCVKTNVLSTSLGAWTIPYLSAPTKLPLPSMKTKVASKNVVSPDLSANEVNEYLPKLFGLFNW